MIVDLNLRGKRVLIVGGGPETERKAWMFLDAGADLTVAAPAHEKSLLDQEGKGRVALITADTSSDLSLVERMKPAPHVVVVHTHTDGPEEPEIARRAKALGCLVYVVDDLGSSDFVQPALASSGFLQVAVSTGGRSPSMARILAQRLAGNITARDLRLVEFIDGARGKARDLISDLALRREALYDLSEDESLAGLIARGDMAGAEAYVEAKLEAAAKAIDG